MYCPPIDVEHILPTANAAEWSKAGLWAGGDVVSVTTESCMTCVARRLQSKKPRNFEAFGKHFEKLERRHRFPSFGKFGFGEGKVRVGFGNRSIELVVGFSVLLDNAAVYGIHVEYLHSSLLSPSLGMF